MTSPGSELLTSRLAEHIASVMANADAGHCVRVDDVNVVLAPELAAALETDLPGVAVHVLRGDPQGVLDIAAERAIEIRNRKQLPCLLIVPAGEGHAGVTIADLKLQRAADGIWRPAADSPVRGAAEVDVVTVKEDIEGQPRTGKVDAGSDQVSDAPVAHRPLTAADVGPGWMPRTAREKNPAGK